MWHPVIAESSVALHLLDGSSRSERVDSYNEQLDRLREPDVISFFFYQLLTAVPRNDQKQYDVSGPLRWHSAFRSYLHGSFTSDVSYHGCFKATPLFYVGYVLDIRKALAASTDSAINEVIADIAERGYAQMILHQSGLGAGFDRGDRVVSPVRNPSSLIGELVELATVS
jgi:hypothetical protein